MDERIREHAEVLVHHSREVSEGDEVVISLNGDTEELAIAVCKELGDIGAIPAMLFGGNFLTGGDRQLAAYMSEADDIRAPQGLTDMLREADQILHLQSHTDPNPFSNLSSERIVSNRRAYGQILKESTFSGCYTLTQFPTASGAKLAGMDLTEYEDYIWNSILQDWDRQRGYQSSIVQRLDQGTKVRVRSNEDTDIRFSIDGMKAVNDYGIINLPGGEVYTAPVLDSIEGRVNFDYPLLVDGKEIPDIQLRFEGGIVVDSEASANEKVLQRLIDLDHGSCRLGEFGIGMNRAHDRYTRNMALDEKMNRTIHFALGTAYPECIGAGNKRNQSSIHVDMLVDMSGDSIIEIDDQVVQENGELLIR